MSNENSPIDDLYNESQGVGTKAKGILNKIPFGAIGRKLALRFATFVSSHIVALIVWAVALLLILIIIIGILAFILTAPDYVRGQVVKMADDMWTSVKGFFFGQAEAQVKKEDVVEIASYLDNSGYKLEGYGFAEKGAVKRDERGKVTDVDSEYITAYLVAENKTYTIANKDFNLRAYFKDVGVVGATNPINAIKLAYGLATGDTDENWGSGMIVINSRLWSRVNAKNVEIDRPKQIMSIKLKDQDGKDKVYEYNLDGWMGRYGKPIEFLLALHTGTMAPDFAYQVAVGDEFDTKVYVRFKKVEVTDRLKYNGEYVFSYERDDGTKIQGWDTGIRSATNTEISNQGSYSTNNRINGVPLYKQWDDAWGDLQYGTGTMADSACGPTSFAMVASWATGSYVSPVDAAAFSVQNGYRIPNQGTDGPNFMPAAAQNWGFNLTQTHNRDDVISALQNGIPVIAAHGSGMFTGSGHFLVYAGLDNSGKLIVNDPNGGVRFSDDERFDLDEVLSDSGQPDWYIPSNYSAGNGTSINLSSSNTTNGGNRNSVNYSSNSEFIVKVNEKVKNLYGISQEDLNAALQYEKENTHYEYKPYIRAVTKHWFRDLDFKDAYVVSENSKQIIGKYGIFDIEQTRKGDIFQIAEPKVVGKEYTVDLEKVVDGTADAQDKADDDSSWLKTAQNVINGFSLNANEEETRQEENDENTSTNTLTSNYEGYRLDELFKQKYNIANGVDGVSEKKYAIQAKTTMRYAITMLESVGTEDSQCILRDLKRYLTKRGFTFTNNYIITDPDTIKDDNDEQDELYENVNQYEGEEYVPPEGDLNMRPQKNTGNRRNGGNTAQKPLGGILDGGMGGVEISEDRKTIIMHHKSPNHTDGFDTGVDVKSPGDGEIKISGDTVKIKLTTQGVRDYTITISGFKPNFNGTTVKRGDVIGQTGDGDITVTMTDAQGNAVSPSNYLPIISADENEVDELARLIQAETDDEEGMIAVGYVVLRRVASSAFPNTIHDVIYEGGDDSPQFAPASHNSRFGGYKMDRPASSTALNIARGVLSGTLSDPIAGKLRDGDAYFFQARNQFSEAQLADPGMYYQCGGNVFFHEW